MKVKQELALEITKAERDRWYTLGSEGTIREQVGMKTKLTKDGRVKARFFVKAGLTMSQAEAVVAVTKAVAFVKGS